MTILISMRSYQTYVRAATIVTVCALLMYCAVFMNWTYTEKHLFFEKIWNTNVEQSLIIALPNTNSTCMYKNLCKEKESDNVYKYIRLPDFTSRMDATVNYNVSITHNERIIPNIVHFTWYGGLKKGNTFRFHHLIAVLAAHRFLTPDRVLFWHDMEPEGKYWTEVNEKVPELTLVYRKAPTQIRGRSVSVPEHLTDVVRLEAVMEFGGMYFDLDAIVLKPLGHLLNYDVVMGYELEARLCNGIMISKPWSEFIRLWHKQYITFDDRNWAHHSVALPAIIAKRHPNLVHTEEKSMHRPNWKETALLYDVGNLYDWRNNNYAVHLWIRAHRTEHNATDIKTWNTTTGEIFRHVYYGDWRIKT